MSMKYLLLMRHAKSSWNDPRLADHERPLNARGQRDAPRMAEVLCQGGLIPDHIVTSTAVRARATAELVASTCGLTDRITATSDLYHAAVDDWRAQVQNLPSDDEIVLCIGHNPGLEDFLTAVTGQYIVMPTAAIAQLSFPGGRWDEFNGAGRLQVENVWRPKDLPHN